MFESLESTVAILIQASFHASILFVLVYAISILLGDYLSAKWQSVLWALPVLRFVCIVVPACSLSMFQFLPAATEATAYTEVTPFLDQSPSIDQGSFDDRSDVALNATPLSKQPLTGELVTERIGELAPVETRYAKSPWSIRRIGFAIWAIGFGVFFSRWLWSQFHLLKLIQRSSPVTEPSLLNMVNTQKKKFGIYRRISCYSSCEVASPATCGTISPVLFLPDEMMGRLAEKEVQMVLAHELSHIKRFDYFQSWLSSLAIAVHWFNPIVYLATDRLKRAMENAADEEAIKSIGSSNVEKYVDLVLGIATQDSRTRTGLLTITGAKKRLEHRLLKLMNASTKRSYGAMLGLPLACTLIVTGLTNLNFEAKQPPQEKSLAVASEIVEEASVPDRKQDGELEISKPENPRASGVVVDFDGVPVEGAMVVYQHQRLPAEELIETSVTTDAKGEFEIEFPPKQQQHDMYHLWAYRKGHPTRVVSLAGKLQRTSNAKDVEIRFAPKQPFEIQIIRADGSLCANKTLQIKMASMPNGVFTANKPTGLTGYVPATLAKLFDLNTDGNGKVVIDCFTKELMGGLDIEDENSGTQEVFRSRQNSSVYRIAPTGSIRGQIFAENPKLYAGTQVRISTSGTRTRGSATVSLDDEGKFEVPAIAAGRVSWVQVRWQNHLDVYPLIVDKAAEIRAGETLVVESQKHPVRMIQIEGAVKFPGENTGVSGASISIRDGRGRSNPTLRTDAEGKFEGRFTVGELQLQVVSLGEKAGIHSKYNYPDIVKVTIPDDAQSPFKVSDLLLKLKATVKGQLLDQQGEPLADETVLLSRGAFGHSSGKAKTDAEGRFEMKVGKDAHLAIKRDVNWGPFYAILRKQDQYGENGEHERLTVIRSNPEDLLLQVTK